MLYKKYAIKFFITILILEIF